MRSAYGLDPKIGGIKVHERTEVIDKKGKTIPGLYAGGLDAAGMWGDS
jgi:fumarate reductase flavoprotein subunit